MPKLQELGFSAQAVATLANIGAQEIAADFIVPKTQGFVSNNTLIPFLPKGWLCFAQSGSGDLWVVDSETSNDVAFVDHDQESGAKAQLLGINLAQWVELAWFMREFDEQDDRRAAPAVKKKRVQEAREFLESLSSGLSKKYPYGL